MPDLNSTPDEVAPSPRARGLVLVGSVLAVLSFLAALGGLRIGALLLFAFDFGFQPYELAVVPFALLSLVLCWRRVPAGMLGIQNIGIALAILALIISLLIAALVSWGIMFAGGGFP